MICAHAGITDPFTLLLVQEGLAASSPSDLPPPVTNVTAQFLQATNTLRLTRKLSHGAFIVESNDSAAVACWEPPDATAQENAEIWDGFDMMQVIPDAERRPIFMDFLAQIAGAKRRVFPRNQRYWHLSLMARDPQRNDKGAVRAVIEPYIQRAREEGVPVWLEAGNERARDVYMWVGRFRVIGEIVSGKGEFDKAGRRAGEGRGEGVRTWLMVANWPVGEEKS